MSGKSLIIAEKPSVATDIARALGKMKRSASREYYENDDYIVSSAVGHLLEIVAPEGVEVKRGKWSLNNLPVLPDHFALQPIKKTESRLRVLAKLYRRQDVESVINACDAGREGELIFHNLVSYLNQNGNKKKPVKRLWLRSMTTSAIRQGFKELRDGGEMRHLQKAAVCRSEADWLIGINATRALTALNSTPGTFLLTTVGRVQTPTLAIIVDRENQIKAFKSQPYWEIRGQFEVASGRYEGLWVDTSRAKNKTDKSANKPERIFDAEQVSQIIADCRDKTGIVSEQVKPSSESPPQLFDLTSLQREANARFGYSARGALSIAQSLYERHKIITYPRTDSRCLPEDYVATVKNTLGEISKGSASTAAFAREILEKGWVAGQNKRIFNNAKISDHFAIVPTGHPPASLRENEQKIYETIVRRFLSIFYPPARFLLTERKTLIGEHTFLTKGKVMKEEGWRRVSGQIGKNTDLPPVSEKEQAQLAAIDSEEKKTLPPARYTEATLLSMMEGAGKLVDDEELREAMRERGLGTPATRASIIEGLLHERYLVRDQRDLMPTPKAHSLIRLLSVLEVGALTLPSMTGEWEYKLRQIEQAQGEDNQFMEEIRALTQTIVAAVKNCGDIDNVKGDYAVLKTPCPECGKTVQESHRRFNCDSCDFFIWKTLATREFSPEEMEILLAGETTGELEGFRSRMGKEFRAPVRLQKNEEGHWQVTFIFERADAQTEPHTEEELSNAENMGACPKCGAAVRHLGRRFSCEKSQIETPTCDFSLSDHILRQEIVPAQVKKLLADRHTDYLEGFISKKTNRPFKARLTVDDAGKIGFEFAPRKKKAGG